MLDRRLLLALMACATALPFRSARALEMANFVAVNQKIAQQHIATRHATFAASCSGLSITLVAFTAGRAELYAARQSFHAAMDAWQAVQHIRFGPSQIDARQFRVQFWPDSRNRIGRQLGEILISEREDLISKPDALAQASIAIQGLPALERLLFEIDIAPGEYAGMLAAAIGDNLLRIAQDLEAEWAPGSAWSQGLYEPGSSSVAYPAPSQASAALLLSLVTQLNVIASAKLREPMGQSAERARPRLSESWRSERSIRNIAINLDALSDLFSGGDGHFANLLIQSGNETLAADLQERLRGCAQIMQGMPASLEVLATDLSLRIPALDVADVIDISRQAVEQQVAPALGLTLGFNSLDGD